MESEILAWRKEYSKGLTRVAEGVNQNNAKIAPPPLLDAEKAQQRHDRAIKREKARQAAEARQATNAKSSPDATHPLNSPFQASSSSHADERNLICPQGTAHSSAGDVSRKEGTAVPSAVFVVQRVELFLMSHQSMFARDPMLLRDPARWDVDMTRTFIQQCGMQPESIFQVSTLPPHSPSSQIVELDSLEASDLQKQLEEMNLEPVAHLGESEEEFDHVTIAETKQKSKNKKKRSKNGSKNASNSSLNKSSGGFMNTLKQKFQAIPNMVRDAHDAGKASSQFEATRTESEDSRTITQIPHPPNRVDSLSMTMPSKNENSRTYWLERELLYVRARVAEIQHKLLLEYGGRRTIEIEFYAK